MSSASNNMTTNYTDEELDRDWKPNGRRPQSSFSAELGDIFRIENSLTDLDREVDTRKQKVTREAEELASLEARLKEMEERLKRSGPSRPSIPTNTAANPSNKDNADAPPAVPSKERSRPGTARQAQHAPGSGNMPPTPGGSEDGDRE